MGFENDNYLVIKNVLSLDMCKFIEIQFELLKNNIISKTIVVDPHLKDQLKNNNKFCTHDKFATNSFSIYSTLFGETLLVHLQKIIETTTKVSLIPTYSYSRIYYHDAILKKHTDRKSCQYSASLCIKNDIEPWPIWLENKNNEKITIKLYEGDMLVYKGIELPHWKEAYEGNQQMQVFLHYVDKNSDLSEYAFDKREYIYLNENRF